MPKEKRPSTGEKQAHQVKRGRNGQFLPGNRSGGRKKLPEELVELCRELTPNAINTAKTIMLDPGAKNSDRLRAAEIIIERGYGKARQAVDVGLENGAPVVFLGLEEVPE